MSPSSVPAVRIEAENEWAWCGRRRLQLMPRTFAVLRHLVGHAGRLVTKEELLAVVWRDTIVSDAALASCIRDLRRALDDAPDKPRYIETVHRRGFRFIGPVAWAAGAEPERTGVAALPVSALVGRDAALARLHEALARAMAGHRQLVFVTGEPGIGKTALVEAFLAQVGRREPLRIGRGQCVEHYGAGEAYLPVLEALGRLGRDVGGDQIIRVLGQHAPTWLVQLPALLDDEGLEIVQRRVHGATRERMLRELVEALDAHTRESPLILVLEDLHWSDASTIDLLAMLARRREPSRLLVVGTYRPADVAAGEHPLGTAGRALTLHGQCEEIPLDFLSPAAVAEYLSRKFGQERWPRDAVALLHHRTDGNPLFLVTLVDVLLAQGQLREVDGHWILAAPVEGVTVDAPATLSQMVERQIERLTPDQQTLLTVAAVAGVEFSTALAAAGGVGEEEAERRCDGLARRGLFLRSAGTVEWPDGTVAGRYAFIHALYQHVLYARIPAGYRAQLHLLTGERLEQAHGPRTAEIAGELAMHFTQGRDFGRAVRYHQQAGGHALGRHGYREAADHLMRALELLESLPDTPARREEELVLRVRLGSALLALEGHAAPAVERAYARARELCEQVGDSPRLLPVLRSLGRFYLVRGSLDAAGDVGRRLQAMAASASDAASLRAAHDLLGHVSFYAGELPTALHHLDRAAELRDQSSSTARVSSALRLVLDADVSCAAHAAWVLWMLGYPARAEARMREALALAEASAHPFSLAHAHRFAAALHHVRRETDRVRDEVEGCEAISAPHVSGGAASPYYGFGAVALAAGFHRGWLLVEEGRHEDGLPPMREWVKTCRDTGSLCLLPAYLASLAETCGRMGRRDEGRDLVTEALAVASGSGIDYWTAELHRLRGELMDGETDAEGCFLEALAVARRQQALSFELRAALSLGRLRARQGRTREAHALLADVHAWFTEGFDTADLEDARVLLETLERGPSR